MIDFIILGAQKAATSSLQASLRRHSSIYMPYGESTFFEAPDYSKSLWVNFGGDSVSKKGIKRPDYLCSDIARERIKLALPECKFIVVLREPISRTISSYCHMVRHAHIPALPLNEGIAICIKDYENRKPSRAATVISYGVYGLHLERWFDIYARERFLILSQSEVSRDLKLALKKCLTHLGVPKAKLGNIPIASGDSNIGLYDPKCLKLAYFASCLKTKVLSGSDRRVPRALPMRATGAILSQFAEARADMYGQKRELLSAENKIKLNQIFNEDSLLLSTLLPTTKFDWIK